MDAAHRGAIMKKTPWEGRELILIMAATSQHFGITWDTLQRVNEANISPLESHISKLTYLVQNMPMAIGNQAGKGLWDLRIFRAPYRHVSHASRRRSAACQCCKWVSKPATKEI